MVDGLKIAPDIPTTAEAGLPGMIAGNFNGLFAPAGVPKSIVDLIAENTRKVVADQKVQELLLKSGFEPTASSGPAQALALVKSELKRRTRIMKATNFKI